MDSERLTQSHLTGVTITQCTRTVMVWCSVDEQLRARFGGELATSFLGYSAIRMTNLQVAVAWFGAFKTNPSCYPGGSPVTALVNMNASFSIFVHVHAI